MEWIDRMNKAIGYIELHLEEKLDYEEAAKICRCPLPKFQQIFRLSTGETLSDYVRYRRMTIAAKELIHSDIKIVDLALKFGYESPEAFTRAYRAFHGVPPSATRKSGVSEVYERIVFQIQVYGGRAKMGAERMLRIETERLIIRKLQPEDWKDLLEIALSKEKSPFAGSDQAWPTDEAGIKRAAEYFSKAPPFWAAEVKDLHKVVCFINFNSMDDVQTLDIGHIVNSDFLHCGYEYEALKALYNHGFVKLHAQKIQAVWALGDKDKLDPLLKLGMKVTEAGTANGFTGPPFQSCTLAVTKEEWFTNPAK